MTENRIEELRVVREFDAVTGRHISERWYGENGLHNEYGPAVREADPEHGALIREEYWVNGQLGGRALRPTISLYDGERQKLIHETYIREGKLHRRPDGPAIWYKDPLTNVVTHEEYWVWGVRHRNKGPAVITRDPNTGEVLTATYYKDGVEVQPSKLMPNPSPNPLIP